MPEGGTGRPWGRLLAAALVAALVAVACARTSAPDGGPVPETPIEVIRTSPDTFAVVDPFDGRVRFDFDRRPSERPTSGQLRDAVVVSPRTGEVRVQHRRHGIDVEMEGGFRERTVYRVTLLPTLQDLWRNTLDGPYDLFFSTGPDFEPNVLGGIIVDRLTGQEVDGARVDARSLSDGPTHSTVTDQEGIFTFPFLPADRYRVQAYEDLNRNRESDFTEPQDSIDVELSPGDTLIVTELALLLPDTTPAVLDEVQAVDSMALRLEFDDPLDPERPLDGVQVRLSREDGEPAPGVEALFHMHEWDAWLEARDREGAEDPPDEEDPPPPPPEPDVAPGDLLPQFGFVVLLDGPLEPEVTYTVVVEGVVNLNGVPGGGGEMEVEGPVPPEEPEEVQPDTIPPPDTLPRFHLDPPRPEWTGYGPSLPPELNSPRTTPPRVDRTVKVPLRLSTSP